MSNNKYIKAIIINNTSYELTVYNINIKSGYIKESPKNIPPQNKKNPIAAFWITGTNTGTLGTIQYKIGNTGKILTINWEIIDPKKTDNTFKSECDCIEYGIKNDGNAYINKDECPIIYTVDYIKDAYSIQIGWYTLFPPIYHAYAAVKDNKKNTIESWFDCYLGHNGWWGNKFPTYSDFGDINLARLIVCGNADDVRHVYNKRMGGYYKNGDSAGILFGISGICHQMANRVYFSCYNDPPILNIPFSKYTYLIWGIYGGFSRGKTWIGWHFPYPFLENIAAISKKEIKSKILILEKNVNPLSTLSSKALNFRLENPTNNEIISNDLSLLIENSFGTKFDSGKMKKLKENHLNFLNAKDQTINQLLNKEINNKKYLQILHKIFNEILKQFANIMGEKDYQTFFEEKPSKKDIKLVSSWTKISKNIEL